MTFQIRPATRADTPPIIGLYGLSGSGKTLTALLLARGLVGPEGKIVLSDSERRGEIFADIVPGGYQVVPFTSPFSPQRHREMLDYAIKQGASVLIFDSASHEWEGVGGVLDMATENQERSGKAGLHNWKVPKMEHNKFLLTALQAPIPLIFCLRAKYKSRQVKVRGDTKVVKDEFTTPIQSDEFIYEMLIHGEMLRKPNAAGGLIGGYFQLTKCTHPDLEPIFRTDKQLSIETGQRLREWASGRSPDRPAAAGDLPPTADDRSSTKREWTLVDAMGIAQQGTSALEAWWKAVPREVRLSLKDELTGLKGMAGAADRAADQPQTEQRPVGLPILKANGDVIQRANSADDWFAAVGAHMDTQPDKRAFLEANVSTKAEYWIAQDQRHKETWNQLWMEAAREEEDEALATAG